MYNDINQINTEINFYTAVQQNGVLNISMLPVIAKQRYPWMVETWDKLYATFKAFANGDQYLESVLIDFNSSVQSYKLGNTLNVLNNKQKFDEYSPFLALILINSLALTPEESVLISNEIQRIQKLTIDDFNQMLDFIKLYNANYSGSIGLGDSDGFSAMGAPQSERIRGATLNDLMNMELLIELTKIIESIIFNLKQINDAPPNLLTIANRNIANPGTVSVNNVYRSYIDVPFEISLEHMALKFMGDRQLWFELVTINNLQPPYVDEIGIKYPLVAPGGTNNVTISSDRKNDIHVGTKISLGSRYSKEEARVINDIIINSNSTMVVFLSGDSDLSKLLPEDEAFVRIYQPHTVNSGSFVKIPVSLVSGQGQPLTPQADVLKRLDKVLLGFGVDILQDETTDDLVIDPNGNFAMAYGIQNIKQAASNALKTTIGELPFHSNYGLDVNIGGKMFGSINQIDAISQIVVSTIKKDPRIESVNLKDITYSMISISMVIEIQIKGSDVIIPLTFSA